jgi:galactonate dehydratase
MPLDDFCPNQKPIPFVFKLLSIGVNSWSSCNSSTVSLAATLQVAAVIPNFLITEYFVNYTEPGNAILENAFEMVDGCFKLPSAPGLGITINEDALKRFEYQESSTRQFRTIKQE